MSPRSPRRAALPNGEQARAAFERAVGVEFHAIERHEAAARRHEQAAAQLEQRALTSPDDRVRDEALDKAANARQRAEAARARAARARQRLRDEGIDVTTPDR